MEKKLQIFLLASIYLISLMETGNSLAEEVTSTSHDVTTTTSTVHQHATVTMSARDGPAEPTPAPAPKELDQLAHAINEFGFKLMTTMMKQKPDENVVISPAGIAGLLAMTLLGTVGVSYDELTEALGFSQDILKNRKNHEQLGDLLRALNVNSSAAQTTYADAIFADTRTHIRTTYRDYLKRIYNGEAFSAEFKDAIKAKNLINNWVKVNTNGKIEDFLNDLLPQDTNVVLLSALYFKGQWQRPFAAERTKQEAFKKTDNKEVLTHFMLHGGHFNYTFSVQNDFHIVALPYKDYSTTMYVLMPRFPKRLSITDLMNKLDYKKINDAINEMAPNNCVIKFPKMKLKSRVDLRGALQTLGVKSVFSPTEANFALMVESNALPNNTDEELLVRINQGAEEARVLKDVLNSLPNPAVFVNLVLHEVKISVDESGTEAAAATIASIARSAISFYADSPFYMFIRDEKSELITFSAIIMDPSVTESS